jgi:hypothetical protein
VTTVITRTAWGAAAPSAIPRVGVDLVLAPTAWGLRAPSYGLVLRIVRVRLDISNPYGGDRVWVEGREVDLPGGHPGSWMQVLVWVDAIPDGVRDRRYRPGVAG